MTEIEKQIRTWDDEDPLASYRERFVIPKGQCYLDGNSLGLLPHQVTERMKEVVEQEWGQGAIKSWNDAGWFAAAQRIGDLAAPLLGANPGEVIVGDSMTVNAFKLLVGFLRQREGDKKILTQRGNFPTDLYIAESAAKTVGRTTVVRVPDEDVLEQIDDSIDLLYLTHVDYRTARIHDMAAITRRAHEVGAIVIWNLAHSAGAMKVELGEYGVDAAVGCGYKYLNGGPGAPAFTYLSVRHHTSLEQPLQGWFGHADPFAFSPDYAPADGINRLQCGTPPILSMAALESSLGMWKTVDLDLLREKSKRLGELFLELVRERCGRDVFELASPECSDQRGSHLALLHPDGFAIMQALIHHGVVGDYREPNLLRFGFAPLYLSYADIDHATSILQQVMSGGEFREERFQQRATVT